MKKAFTMIELVFVIIVVGILAAIALPRADVNNLNEAADQIVSHIRYTQHLAMQDNKFNPADQFWYRSRWEIRFCLDGTNPGGQCSIGGGETGWGYSIYSDSGTYNGNPAVGELAVNPQNPSQLMTSGYNGTILPTNGRTMEELRLTRKYGIESITFGAICGQDGAKSISFDSFGRPLYGHFQLFVTPYSRNVDGTNVRLITQRCTITICTVNPCPATDGDTRKRIAIEPETGYTHIL